MTGPNGGSDRQAEVRLLAETAAEACGLVVEDVRVQQAGQRRVVRVVVDLPASAVGSVPLDAVAAVSQALSESLDAGDVLGEVPYMLEVTSPGIDRPLRERRHFARARTRLVRVSLAAGGVAEGRLIVADDDGVVLLDPKIDPRGERPSAAQRRLTWEEIGEGRMLVEFSRAWDDAGLDDADLGDDLGDEQDDELDDGDTDDDTEEGEEE